MKITKRLHGCFVFRYKKQLTIGVMSILVVFLLMELSRTDQETKHSQADAMMIERYMVKLEEPQPDFSCVDRRALEFNRTEDIFCIVLPPFSPRFKNPCFYDYYKNSAQLRCLPYFYIIGIDKSGSTDLHSRLSMHPLVLGNRGDMAKETSFWPWLRYGIFNKRFLAKKMSLEEYMDMFNDTADIIVSTNVTSVITGDATPMDLWDFRNWKNIPQNMGREEPKVLTPHFLKYLYKERTPKLMIQLREPVERLYSDYIFLEYGKNPKQFHNHSLIAIKMMKNCLAIHSRRICYFSDTMYRTLPVRIHLGCYSVFLKEWFKVFPRSAFHITRTDEYQNDMENTLREAFKFLELETLPEFKMAVILNQTRRHVTSKKKGVIFPETVTALRNFYKDCNQETAELLQDDRFLWDDHYS